MSVTAESKITDVPEPFDQIELDPIGTAELSPANHPFYPVLENPLETKISHIEGKIAGGKARVEGTLEGPVDTAISDELPAVILFHGLLGVEGAYAGLRTALAQRGYLTLSTKPFRGEGLIPALDPRNALSPVRLASRAALGLAREVTKLSGHEEFDGLTHSNGTQTALDLALHKKLDVIRGLVIMGGVGLEDNRFREMPRRAVDFGRNDFWPSRDRRLGLGFVLEEAEYILGNPGLTAAETLSAGSCKVGTKMDMLKERGKKIGGVLFVEDDFIRVRAVQSHSGSKFDVLHIYRNPTARHTAPQDYPSDVAEAYLEVSDEMNADRTLSLT